MEFIVEKIGMSRTAIIHYYNNVNLGFSLNLTKQNNSRHCFEQKNGPLARDGPFYISKFL